MTAPGAGDLGVQQPQSHARPRCWGRGGHRLAPARASLCCREAEGAKAGIHRPEGSPGPSWPGWREGPGKRQPWHQGRCHPATLFAGQENILRAPGGQSRGHPEFSWLSSLRDSHLCSPLHLVSFLLFLCVCSLSLPLCLGFFYVYVGLSGLLSPSVPLSTQISRLPLLTPVTCNLARNRSHTAQACNHL